MAWNNVNIERDIVFLFLDKGENGGSVSNILQKIEHLESTFVPTYHQAVKLKYKFVCEYQIEKQDCALQKLKAKFCLELLPVFDRLEGGEGNKLKGEVLLELAKTELILMAIDLNQKKLSKEEYLKKIKPYVALQMKASKMIKSFAFWNVHAFNNTM